MELTIEQYEIVEPDPRMRERVRRVVEESGFGQVAKVIKIQDSMIVLEEFSEIIKKKP